MAAFVDARVVKNTYKGGDVRYVVEVAYESDAVSGEEPVLSWHEHSSISTNNSFKSETEAKVYRVNLLNQILVKSEVVE